MDVLDAAPVIFDPNSLMTTNHIVFLFSCWALMPPSDSSQPVDIFSQFKVKTISHIKMPDSPEHEFLIIETVDTSNESYSFILERRSSEMRTGLTPVEPISSYRTRLVEKLHKLISTMKRFIVPDAFAFDSLSIGDKTTISLIQSSDLMSHSIDKSDGTPALDRFLGQNFLRSPRFHGQVVAYFKPHDLSLFQLTILAHVVHEMYPTYTILGEQCFFYARLVYAAVQDIFGISPSISHSADEDLVYSIDSHHMPFKYGRWKGLLVNLLDEDTVPKVREAYAVAFSNQITKITGAANLHRVWDQDSRKLELIESIVLDSP